MIWLHSKRWIHSCISFIFRYTILQLFRIWWNISKHYKIKDHYSEQLAANGCNINCLNAELQILYSHVNKFLSNVTPSKCWPCLFKLKEGLDIKNILHIAEICISIPLSNTECECIFSFLWRHLTKDCLSINNETLERILQFRLGTGDYSISSMTMQLICFLQSTQTELSEKSKDNQMDIIIHQKESN